MRNDPNFKCKHILSVMNCIPRGQVENGKLLEKIKPRLDERFIIQIEGRDFVKYAGLLDLGHQKGISQIEVEILQMPAKENGDFAICKALVVSKSGETFSDIGDANPANCNSKVVRHLLRMASTRAIARALRSYTNIGMTCLEELGDLEDVIGDKKGASKKPAAKAPAKPAKKKAEPKAKAEAKPKAASKKKKEAEAKPPSEPASNQPGMSEAQKRAIYNLSRRRGISVEELENMATETYGVSLEELSSKDASSFIRHLQQAA